MVIDKKKTIKNTKKRDQRDLSNLDTPDEKENSINMEDSNDHAAYEMQSKDEVFDIGKKL